MPRATMLLVPLLLCLAAATAVRGQEPDQQAAAGVRLVYDLPAYDASKRMAATPGTTLDAVVEAAIRSVQERLGEAGKVERLGATGFTVEVSAAAGDIAALRQRIENIGKLEMRLVAAADYVGSNGGFDLAQEKQRLLAWLDGGGRKLLQQDPGAIAQYIEKGPGPLAAGRLGWFVHRIEPLAGDPQRWQPAFAAIPGDLTAATVMVDDAARYNGGRIPAAVQALPREQQRLLELVAINLDEVHFGNDDLDQTRVSVGRGQDGSPVVNYVLRPARVSAYADWSEKYIRHHVAILVDDRVRSAPMFITRVPGSGQISGSFTADEAAGLARALHSAPLPVAPVLMRQESAAGTGASRRRPAGKGH